MSEDNKTKRSSIQDRSAEKRQELERIMAEEKARTEMMNHLIVDGEIDFAKLPKMKPEMREVLLNWISRGLEDNDRTAKTEDGRKFRIETGGFGERCRITCADGIMDLPYFKIIFLEDV